MFLSIIIPAHNAAGYLAKTIPALAGYSRETVEVIVVDDASSDATQEALKCHDHIRVLRLDKISGPASARNTGAAAARGKILFFSDADIVLPANAPELISDFFTRQAQADVFSGVYAPDRQESNILTKYRNLKETHEELSRAKVNYACRSSLLAIRKEVFERLGGFDEGWARLHCEDAIFCAKLAKNKIRVYVDPALEARHLKIYTFGGFLKQTFIRTIAVYYAARKIGRDFMSNYYNRGAYFNSLIEIVSPPLVVLSAFIFLFFRLPLSALIFIVFNLSFFYAQKGFYFYALRTYGPVYVLMFYILRFMEMLVSCAALCSILLRLDRRGICP